MTPTLYSNLKVKSVNDDDSDAETVEKSETQNNEENTVENVDVVKDGPVEEVAKPKKPRTEKQQMAIKKARAALGKKRKEVKVSFDTATDKVLEPPPDAEPPLWFKNFIQSKIQEKAFGLKKVRERKVQNVIENNQPEPKVEPTLLPPKPVQQPVQQPPIQPVYRNPIFGKMRSNSIFGR